MAVYLGRKVILSLIDLGGAGFSLRFFFTPLRSQTQREPHDMTPGKPLGCSGFFRTALVLRRSDLQHIMGMQCRNRCKSWYCSVFLATKCGVDQTTQSRKKPQKEILWRKGKRVIWSQSHGRWRSSNHCPDRDNRCHIHLHLRR